MEKYVIRQSFFDKHNYLSEGTSFGVDGLTIEGGKIDDALVVRDYRGAIRLMDAWKNQTDKSGEPDPDEYEYAVMPVKVTIKEVADTDTTIRDIHNEVIKKNDIVLISQYDNIHTAFTAAIGEWNGHLWALEEKQEPVKLITYHKNDDCELEIIGDKTTGISNHR